MLKPFFSPDSSGSNELFDQVVLAYASATRDRLAVRVDATIPSLNAHSEMGAPSRAACQLWMPEMGNLNGLLRDGAELRSAALAQFVLCAVSLGSEWELDIETVPGRTLYFQGHKMTTGERLFLRSTGSAVGVDIDADRKSYIRSGRQWLVESQRQAGRFYDVHHDVLILAGECADSGLMTDEDATLPDDLFGEAAQRAQESLELIRLSSEQYLRWCLRVLRQVHLVKSPGATQTTSRSGPLRPGGVLLSHPASVLHYAESLVHECTHQYYYMASLLTPILKDSSDTRLYYSPITKSNRALDRILLAYHATANILFFLEKVQCGGTQHAEEAADRMRAVSPVCWHLMETLSSNHESLTENANSLWRDSAQPVAELYARHGLRKTLKRS